MGTRLVLIPCVFALITLSHAAPLDLDAAVRKFEGASLVGDYDIFVKQGRCPTKISHAAFSPVELDEGGKKFDAYSIKHSDIEQDSEQCTSAGNFAIVPNAVINAAGYRDALGEQAPVVKELLDQNAQFLVGVELAERTCGASTFSENALAIFIEQESKVLVPGLITLYPGARYMVIYDKTSPTPCTYFQPIPGRSIGEAAVAEAEAAEAAAAATGVGGTSGSGDGGAGDGGAGDGGAGDGGSDDSGSTGTGEGGASDGGASGTAPVAGPDDEFVPASTAESGTPATGTGAVGGHSGASTGSGASSSAGGDSGAGAGPTADVSGGPLNDGSGNGPGAGPGTEAGTGGDPAAATPAPAEESSGGIIGGTAAGIGSAAGAAGAAIGLDEGGDEDIIGFGFPEESVEPVEDDGGSVCFPADATVELENGSTVAMESLQLGDSVLVGPNTYSNVFMFTHRMTAVQYPFVELDTVSGKTLTLTSGHYLYINGKLATAGSASVGDETSDGQISAIRNNVMKRGLYNPQTTHGDIIVNGIQASTYTTAVQPNTAHCMLAPMRSLYSALGYSTQLLHQGADTLASVLPSGSS